MKLATTPQRDDSLLAVLSCIRRIVIKVAWLDGEIMEYGPTELEVVRGDS